MEANKNLSFTTLLTFITFNFVARLNLRIRKPEIMQIGINFSLFHETPMFETQHFLHCFEFSNHCI